MLPLLSSITEGHSFIENLKMFLFNPFLTHQGDPWMNLYLSSVLATFGFQAKYFIFILLAFHFLCAILFYSLLRKMRLDFRIAFFSAIVYLTTFIHFSYYTWPMSAHHLFVLLLSLLVLNLYFETTNRIDEDRPWKTLFWLTICINFLAPFCQITILLLPAGILAHILISAKDAEDRLKKYDIWLPLFITYLGYPVMRFLCIGYIHLERFFHLAANETRSVMSFPVFFLAGIGALFLFRGILKSARRYDLGRALKALCVAAVFLYIILFIIMMGRADLMTPSKVKLYDYLSPYNFIRPFGMMFVDFIFPIRSALSMSSAMSYHVIPPSDNLIGNLICLFLMIIFMRKYFFRHKGLIVFILFYLVAMRYMRIMTTMLYSRHFIYVTPLFSIVFSSSAVYIYDLIADKARLRKVAREAILVLLFVGLCIPNILAIRIALVRGRLVNTFLIYDYIRAAHIIKDDIRIFEKESHVKGSDIFIEGVKQMSFNVDIYWNPAPGDPSRFAPFRYVLVQVLDDKSMLDVSINGSGAGSAKLAYEIKNFEIYDAKGRNIDRFRSYFDRGVEELMSGNGEEASASFRKAIEVRPFLVNYVLLKYQPGDIRWISNGSDLKGWIGEIGKYYDNCDEAFYVAKVKYVLATIESEINDYVKCLFYEAYLDNLFGRLAESKKLLSELGFIDNDRNDVSSLMKDEAAFRSNKKMHIFLQNMKATAEKPDFSIDN